MTHDPYGTPPTGPRRAGNAGSWTWVAGIVVIVIIGLIIWGLAGSNTNTASNQNPSAGSPPATTGSAPAAPPPAAPQGTKR